MATYLIRRLLLMVPTLIGITFLVFMIVALAPGGIGASLKVSGGGAMESQKGTAVLQAYLDDRYGLDEPVIVQYGRWLKRISPVKFGRREQVSPTGEVLRSPRHIKTPPVWKWVATELPEPPPVTVQDLSAMSDQEKHQHYQKNDRIYADARNAFTAAATVYRQTLREYAEAAGIPNAVDRDGKIRERIFERMEPDKTSPVWPKVEQAGAEMIAAYKNALAVRSDFAGVFAGKPYPQAGIGIDGVVSLAPPDFGVSFSRGSSVSSEIGRALPVTILLNLIAFPIIYLVAISGGMLAAVKKGTAIDAGLGMLFISMWSFPVVLAGVLSIGFLASKDYWGKFPAAGLHSNDANTMPFLPGTVNGVATSGYLLDMLWHICLPVMCLVYTGFAILSKQTRAAMLENFNADYVRTAKAKGVAPKDVIFRHVFRNSLLPLITMFVSIFPTMLAGSVVVEKVFTVPGMGSLILQAISLRDRELLLANTLMIATVNLVALLLADILYAIADPRVAYD